MRRHPSSSLPSRVGAALATFLLSASISSAPGAGAFTFEAVTPSHLNIDNLGRVAFAGDFDGLSLYEYREQNEQPFNTNGSQSLLSRFPNGAFASLSQADAYIEAMCPYVLENGTLRGVVVGGNFTSLGGVEAQGIALVDPDTAKITPLPGLSGKVSALYCDQNTSSVYIGGTFSGANSTNAIVWNNEWTNLPFAGFNGAVNSITKASNGNIIFGGSFTGLGNTTTPAKKDMQSIPIASANITATSSTTTAGFSDPRNILCKEGEDGSGNAWLLADNTAGSWTASFQFGFQPTKLRLYNTKQDGRGTKTWRFTALPINGIMNLTYTDESGKTAFCDARCPLPQGNSSFQDFRFVNSVGMNTFRIDITEWYGNGGGLAGIELFEDDIYSFAVNDFNQPICKAGAATSTNLPSSTITGNWVISPSLQSTSEWLTITLNGTDIDPDQSKVVFTPNVEQSGNYSVTLFTPGCIQDGTCNDRGRVNITTSVKSKSSNQATSTELFQTNYFDKYDQVYLGYIDASSPPTVTLQPSSGQSGRLTVVAQRVRFELLSNVTAGLNGLFEYNPDEQTIDSSQFTDSAVDSAGLSLEDDAHVSALAVVGNDIFAAGEFKSSNSSNIIKITNDGVTSLSGGGLNSEVMTMYQNGSQIFVGGNFTNTADNKATGLNGVAVYSASDNTWTALGAGVNGVVTHIVPFTLNFTANRPETVLAVTGFFSQVLGFGDNSTFAAKGLAVWVPSHRNWLQNTGLSSISIDGSLQTTTDVPGFTPMFAGSVSSQALAASGAVGLTGSSSLSLQQLPVKLRQTTSSSLSKRAVNGQNLTGATTGLIYTENNLNITILAGHFTATSSSGANISNIIFINGSGTVSGIGDGISTDSTFMSLGTQGTLLFAGGSISGSVKNNDISGLVAYDLASSSLLDAQPDGLVGNSVSVNAIATRPSSQEVYVGGQFQSAGSLTCPGLCIYNTQRNQWLQPGSGISGTVNSLIWITDTRLVIAGNLTVGENVTTVATYDSKSQQFRSFDGAGNMPGAVTSLCAANKDGSQFWAAGKASDGSAFLQRYDGSQWRSAASLGAGSTIHGIQVFSLRQNHDKTDLLDQDQALLVLGSLVIPNYGNASSALFDGTTYTPFIISTTSNNAGGTLVQAFVEKPQNFFQSDNGHLALGFIVLIALAIALGLIFCITVGGFLAERHRRRKEGYIPAPTSMPDRGSSNMSRIPPSELFGTIGQGQGQRSAQL